MGWRCRTWLPVAQSLPRWLRSVVRRLRSATIKHFNFWYFHFYCQKCWNNFIKWNIEMICLHWCNCVINGTNLTVMCIDCDLEFSTSSLRLVFSSNVLKMPKSNISVTENRPGPRKNLISIEEKEQFNK